MSTSGFARISHSSAWVFCRVVGHHHTETPLGHTFVGRSGCGASYLSRHWFIIIQPPHSGLPQPFLPVLLFLWNIFAEVLVSRNRNPRMGVQTFAERPSHQPSIPCQAVPQAKANQTVKARNAVSKKWLTSSVITISELVSYVSWVLCQRTWHVWHCLRCWYR